MLLTVSVIIVNYNVKYFLGHCIASVKKALTALTGEIIVVDNASTDGSCSYLRDYFPEILLIENAENKGFAKACNTGAAAALGKYLLFLNPDTLLSEQVIKESIAFYQVTPKAGAVGVQMIDGSGKFLPESKRSLPTILSSFYKLSGLSFLFPSSKKINQYALGDVDKNAIHEADIISGACMLVAKNIFDECNGFDEQFFMYGEDIDLSYRIKQSGYNNFYLGNLSILHFKGGSLAKPNIMYTKIFYGAIKVFVEKYYKKNKTEGFIRFIQWLINIVAVATFTKQIFKRVSLPLLDFFIVFCSLLLTKNLWVIFIKQRIDFDTCFVSYTIPAYTITFISIAYFSGIYDNLYKLPKAIPVLISAVVVLLAFYSLLLKSICFSIGVALVGSIGAIFFILFSRWLLSKLKWGNYEHWQQSKFVIIGNKKSTQSIIDILKQFNQDKKIVAVIPSSNYLPALKQSLSQVAINEIIFSENDLTISETIVAMKRYSGQYIFSFYSSVTDTIIKSHNKHSNGIYFTASGSFNLLQPHYKRLKRMIDIAAALVLLFSFPVHILFIKNSGKVLKKCWSVLAGYKTFIGYHLLNNTLPPLKTGIFTCSVKTGLNETTLTQIDELYAKDYNCRTDIRLIILNYKHLGK